MHKTFLFVGAIGLALLGSGCAGCGLTTPDIVIPPTPTSTEVVPPTPTSTPALSEQGVKANLITVTGIADGQHVESPLTVTGQARGNWYFEASFPVELRDGNNVILAQKPAQAQGNWMTTNFVPYSVTLTFPAPTTATGTLILRKDNPSGEPQNDDQLAIPVTF